MKSLTYSETNIEIERDLETGKATKQHERKTYKVKIEQEPDFVKLYLKDICKFAYDGVFGHLCRFSSDSLRRDIFCNNILA